MAQGQKYTIEVELAAEGFVRDSARIKKGGEGIGQGTEKAAKGSKNLNSSLSTLKKTILGLGLGLVAKEAVQFATAFDDSLTQINTLVGVSADQVAAWRGEILQIAPDIGRSAGEMAKALFVVTSAGEKGAGALDLVENAGKASAIGMGEMSEIARVTTAAVTAFGKENLSSAQAMDILVATVRSGNLEAASLAPVLGQVIGVASQLGISFDEVGAFIATYTKLGLSASQATTGLAGVMRLIFRPTEQARKVLKGIGISVDELRRSVAEDGLASTMIALTKSLEGNLDALGKVVPETEALAALMGVAAAQADTYLEVQDEITNSSGILAEAFSTVKEESPGQTFREIASLVETLAISFGLALAPALKDALEKLQEFIGDSSRVQNAATGIGQAVAALVDVIIWATENAKLLLITFAAWKAFNLISWLTSTSVQVAFLTAKWIALNTVSAAGLGTLKNLTGINVAGAFAQWAAAAKLFAVNLSLALAGLPILVAGVIAVNESIKNLAETYARETARIVGGSNAFASYLEQIRKSTQEVIGANGLQAMSDALSSQSTRLQKLRPQLDAAKGALDKMAASQKRAAELGNRSFISPEKMQEQQLLVNRLKLEIDTLEESTGDLKGAMSEWSKTADDAAESGLNLGEAISSATGNVETLKTELEELKKRIEVFKNIESELNEIQATADALNFDEFWKSAGLVITQSERVAVAIGLGVDPLTELDAKTTEWIDNLIMARRELEGVKSTIEAGQDILGEVPEAQDPTEVFDGTLEDALGDMFTQSMAEALLSGPVRDAFGRTAQEASEAFALEVQEMDFSHVAEGFSEVFKSFGGGNDTAGIFGELAAALGKVGVIAKKNAETNKLLAAAGEETIPLMERAGEVLKALGAIALQIATEAIVSHFQDDRVSKFGDDAQLSGDFAGEGAEAGKKLGGALGGPVWGAIGAFAGGIIGGFIKKSADEGKAQIVEAVDGAAAAITIDEGGLGQVAQQVAEGIIGMSEEIEGLVGTDFDLSAVEISVSDNIVEVVAGGVRGYFSTLEHAIGFGVAQVLRTQGDLPPEVEQAIQGFAGSVEELHERLAVALEVQDLRLGPDTARLKGEINDLFETLRKASEFGIDTSGAIETFFTDTKNGILGIAESEEERLRRLSAMFNAELVLVEAKISAMKFSTEAEIAATRATLTGAEATLTVSKIRTQSELAAAAAAAIGVKEFTSLARAVGGATNSATQLANLERQLAGLEQALSSLPAQISELDIQASLAAGGGGGAGQLNSALQTLGGSLQSAHDTANSWAEALQVLQRRVDRGRVSAEEFAEVLAAFAISLESSFLSQAQQIFTLVGDTEAAAEAAALNEEIRLATMVLQLQILREQALAMGVLSDATRDIIDQAIAAGQEGVGARAEEVEETAGEAAVDVLSAIDERLAQFTSIGQFVDQMASLDLEFDTMRIDLRGLIDDAKLAGESTAHLSSRLESLDAIQANAAQAIQLDFLGSLQRLGVEVPGLAAAMLTIQIAQAKVQAIALFATASSTGAIARGAVVAAGVVEDATGGMLQTYALGAQGMVDITANMVGSMVSVAASSAEVVSTILDEIGGASGDGILPGIDISLAELLAALDQALEDGLEAIANGGSTSTSGGTSSSGTSVVNQAAQDAANLLASLANMETALLSPTEQINAQFDEMLGSFQDIAAQLPGLGTSLAEVTDRIEALRDARLEELFDRATSSLRDLYESLTTGAGSGLSIQDQLLFAQQEVMQLAAAAAAGDLEAAAALGPAIQDALGLASQMFGSGGGFGDFRDQMIALMEDVLGISGLGTGGPTVFDVPEISDTGPPGGPIKLPGDGGVFNSGPFFPTGPPIFQANDFEVVQALDEQTEAVDHQTAQQTEGNDLVLDRFDILTGEVVRLRQVMSDPGDQGARR